MKPILKSLVVLILFVCGCLVTIGIVVKRDRECYDTTITAVSDSRARDGLSDRLAAASSSIPLATLKSALSQTPATPSSQKTIIQPLSINRARAEILSRAVISTPQITTDGLNRISSFRLGLSKPSNRFTRELGSGSPTTFESAPIRPPFYTGFQNTLSRSQQSLEPHLNVRELEVGSVLKSHIEVVPRNDTDQFVSPQVKDASRRSAVSVAIEALSRPLPVYLEVASVSMTESPIDAHAPPRESSKDSDSIVALEAEPVDPSEYVSSLAAREPALSHWIQQWESDQLSISSQNKLCVATLSDILNHCNLTSRELYILTLGAEFLSRTSDSRNSPVVDCLTDYIISVAGKELEAQLQASRQSREVVSTVAHLFWLFDAHDYPRLAAAYSLITKYLPSETKEARRAQFLKVEALYAMNDIDASYSALQDILKQDNADFKGNDLISFNWMAGLICAGSGHSKESVAYFADVCDCVEFRYCANAWQLKIVNEARMGDCNSASHDIIEWIRRFRPSASEVAPVLAFVDRHQPNKINIRMPNEL